VLGDIPTIGWVRGTSDYLAVPDDLTHQARWAKAQGHGIDVADHPDAEAAVHGIGSDGRLRQHLLAAVEHLLRANECPEVVSFVDHSIVIVQKLQEMIAQQRDVIEANLARHGRRWADLLHYFAGMQDWCNWLLDHPGALNRKTITLSTEERVEPDEVATREAIFTRVERTIEQFSQPNAFEQYGDEFIATVVLLVAPTGSRKSTLMRTTAVRHVIEHPGESVAISVPRHRLGAEQIEMLQREHPDGHYRAAVWRGRHADDPEQPHPQRRGAFRKMCWRSDEAEEVELALLNVEHALCKQGRGDKVIKCRFYDRCGYQRQKLIEANIWFAAHECMVHEMPKTLGKVTLVMVDESPLDAFMFGIDRNDQKILGLDTLKHAPDDAQLLDARATLYRGLDQLRVPIESWRGVPASRQSLHAFVNEREGNTVEVAEYNANRLRSLELRGKVVPNIRPDMSKEEVRTELAKAQGNRDVKKLATLWQLIEQVSETEVETCGRIQIHRGKEGRVIRMVGLHAIAKGWNVRTLICDATGDAKLLQAIWPQLETDESVQGWQQLPRPKSVRIFQCVNRSITKWHVAVEGKNEKELGRKIEGARRLYAALLMKALEYGGAEVAAIMYKSTRIWIEQNCFVPAWLKLVHWGDVTGTNALQNVRALFVIGRPLAAPEDVTRQTEALFGRYIPKRDYHVRRKHGRIPTVPDSKGINTIRVDVREMVDPMAQRMVRQITEAAIIQAVGRARAGLRSDAEPLDIHLWTDVPVPELGPVEPVLWSELETGLDGVMLATGGIWLESATHAAQAYNGLFTVDGLRSGRKKHTWCFPNRDSLLAEHHLCSLRYQRAGERQRHNIARALMEPTAARAWLEARLGRLASFEIIAEQEAVPRTARRGRKVTG
jgi:putative DNA primase/helicase